MLSALAGCAPAPTQIVIVADSDLPGLTSIEVRVTGSDGTTETATFDPARQPLPGTLGVIAESGTPTITIEATAHAGEVSVAQRWRTTFVAGETRALSFFLAEACAPVDCTGETTCDRGVCRSIDRDPTTLPRWQGTIDPADAGTTSPDGGSVEPDAGPDPERVLALAGGGAHTCAILSDGSARCWGSNASGQLGDGTTVASSTAPVVVMGVEGASAIAAGRAHSCAIVAGGEVRCWGENLSGQLGGGTTSMRAGATRVMGLAGATALCAGEDHTCALLADGSVRCWGGGDRFQLGDRMLTDYSPRPVDAMGVTGAGAIACGAQRTCVRQGSTMRCFGRNDEGQIGDGSTMDRASATAPAAALSVTAIATGERSSCAVAESGAFCFGANDVGQLGAGTTSARELVPTRLPSLPAASSIAIGRAHACALAGGAVLCWGAGARGELGRGTTAGDASPEPVTALTASAITLALGASHACALTTGGVFCWGANDEGQLGDGTRDDRSAPVPVRMD